MRPDLAAAITELEAKAATSAGETATGYRHAALVARLFREPARTLQQLQHHAGFWKHGAPDKAAAYRDSFAIVTRLTGEELPLVIVRHQLEHLEQGDFLLT